MNETTVLLDNIYFGEGPRWKEGKLWFSDIFGKTVYAMDIHSGSMQKVCEVEGEPSGLGWLPDGRLLVVSMKGRKVMRLEGDGTLQEHADLSHIATYHANDMVVDEHGRAYVGNLGFDFYDFIKEHGREAAAAPDSNFHPANLACIEPNGSTRVAAEGLICPNGSVFADGGSTLIVAETFRCRLTAFDVASDGSLSNRRIWAQLGNTTPDGICIDVEGAVWVADAGASLAMRVAEGGEVLDRIKTSQRCTAVALGGEDGRTLYCTTAPLILPSELRKTKLGKIEQIRVDVPSI